MRKTQVIYLVTMLMFAAGMWAVLRIGSELRAARNVAGEWQLNTASQATNLPERLTIQQSGRFLTGVLGDPSAPISMRGELPQGSTILLAASHPQLSLTATLNEAGDKFVGRVDGAVSSELSGTRLPAR
ncbi:MAG TPA: hypothetical protein VK797_20420 [Tepidisphaeraceae bacterium]|jgi:hypothetical protein|nr:hypothetical protein [Tepidisphaeraceae bacterium]